MRWRVKNWPICWVLHLYFVSWNFCQPKLVIFFNISSNVISMFRKYNIYYKVLFALRIAVEILFEERKKIATESLAEGNALNIFLIILPILLSFDKLSYQKYTKPYDFVEGNSCGPLIKWILSHKHAHIHLTAIAAQNHNLTFEV